jgi:2EXR family
MANRPSEFPNFPKLATELQEAILREAAKFPRVIIFSPDYFNADFHPTSRVAPALLHASRISRYATLSLYERIDFGVGPPVYIFPKIDTIYFTGRVDLPLTFLQGSQVTFITSIALGLRDIMDNFGRLNLDEFARKMNHFPSLKTVHVVTYAPTERFNSCVTGFGPYRESNLAWKEEYALLKLEKEISKARLLEEAYPGMEKLPQITAAELKREVDYRANHPLVRRVLRRSIVAWIKHRTTLERLQSGYHKY